MWAGVWDSWCCSVLLLLMFPPLPPVRCINARRSSFQGWSMVLLCVAGVPLLSERVLYMFGDSVCRWSFRPVQCCYCTEVRKPERETCMPANGFGKICEVIVGPTPVQNTRITLAIKLNMNWKNFQLTNSAPPLSVTGSCPFHRDV